MPKTALQKIESMLEKCGELLSDVEVDEWIAHQEIAGRALQVYAGLEWDELVGLASELPEIMLDRESFLAGMRFAAKMLINHDIDRGVLD